MLNTVEKMMENMLWARLKKAIEEDGGLSEEQHGFREGHSKIDASGMSWIPLCTEGMRSARTTSW